MIQLTKINGKDCFLNHLLIEIMEESPDTCITLKNGNRYLVRESCAEIRDKILEFQAEVLQRAEALAKMDSAEQYVPPVQPKPL
jgi:flagellar protein FlbD